MLFEQRDPTENYFFVVFHLPNTTISEDSQFYSVETVAAFSVKDSLVKVLFMELKELCDFFPVRRFRFNLIEVTTLFFNLSILLLVRLCF